MMEKFGGFAHSNKVPVERFPRSRNTGGWADEVSSSNSGKEKFMPTPGTANTVGYSYGLKRTSDYEPEDYVDKRRRLNVSSHVNTSCYTRERLSRQSFVKQPEGYGRSDRDYTRDDRYVRWYNYEGSSVSDVGSKIDNSMYTKSADRYADDRGIDKNVSEQSLDESRRLNYGQGKYSDQEYLQKFKKDSFHLHKNDRSDKFNRSDYQDSKIDGDLYLSQDLCPGRYEKPRDEFKQNKSSAVDEYSRGCSELNINRNPSQYLNPENNNKIMGDDLNRDKGFEHSRDYYMDSKINRNSLQVSEPERYARYQSVSNQNEKEIYLKHSDTYSRMGRDLYSSYDFSSRDSSIKQNKDYEPTVLNQRDDREFKQFDKLNMLTDPYVETISKYGRNVVEQHRFPSDVNSEKRRSCFMEDQLNDYRQVDDYKSSKNYFESVNNQDRSRSLIAAGGYEKYKKDGQNPYLGPDKSALHVPDFERQVTLIGSKDDCGYRKDDYNLSRSNADNYNQSRMLCDNNKLRTHEGSDNFRNVRQDDYDQLRDSNYKTNILSREQKSRSYSRAGNFKNSDGIDLYRRNDGNTINRASPIQDKIRYSDHCSTIVAEHYKISNNNYLPHHSDSSSRRENVEKYPNFNNQWNKNGQQQSKFNLMKSGNVTSTNENHLSNYHNKTAEQLSTNIHSQIYNKDKNNKSVLEQTEKNTLNTVHQNLPKSNILGRISSPLPSSGTYRTENVESIPSLKEDQLCNKSNDSIIDREIFPWYRKDSRVVQSNIQSINSGMISDNKCDERVPSALRQVNTKPNVPSKTETKEDKNVERNLNKDQSLNEFDATKYSDVVRSVDIQPTNGTICDDNKSDGRVLSVLEQVNAQSNVTSSIKTEDYKNFEKISNVNKDQSRNEVYSAIEKNVATNTLGLGLDMEQNQPEILSTVCKNKASFSVGNYSTDDNSDEEEEEEDCIRDKKLPGKLQKYSSLIKRYNVHGPCGNMIVVEALNENTVETFARIRSLMRRKLVIKKIFDTKLRQWVYRALMYKYELANVAGCKKGETKKAASRLALKTLQRYYYTLLMRHEYFAPVDQVVHVSGRFGPPIPRKSVKRANRFAERVDFKETLKRIDEFISSDVVHDLVFSFRFPPNVRLKLASYARNHGLRVRRLGPNRFKFLVMSKEENLWKIIEGVTNNDTRYVYDYKLVPPGRYDLMYFE